MHVVCKDETVHCFMLLCRIVFVMYALYTCVQAQVPRLHTGVPSPELSAQPFKDMDPLLPGMEKPQGSPKAWQSTGGAGAL
jgi:hypothetical protein